MESKTIVQQHSQNFHELSRAFRDESVCLMDCIEKATGEHVAVICAAMFNPTTNETEFVPFARFFNGNPFELLIPPGEYDCNR